MSTKPKSARRARAEADWARLYGKRLPSAHPYALLPVWAPYPLARIVGSLLSVVVRDRG